MQGRDPRKCRKCGYEIFVWWISDAHDPNTYSGFEAVQLRGRKKGQCVEAKRCPKCGAVLTFESTQSTAPKPKPDYCGSDCAHREERPRDIDNPTSVEQRELESEIFSALKVRGFHLLCLMNHLDNVGRNKRPRIAWGDGLVKSTILCLCTEGKIAGDYFGILRSR
ncbi:MAG: hypothetical protein A2945_00975 [Candidatus Liptonbacteria bacterium RIFCSPLOWO2_01_FULL_52_25]|uniref:Uncharacterized protein n=1 Tax=Candidatus Liptonbacteria bacterium RIFCSPLOWO2_01_FULL_52_25 TaxID=1798650 RepID=A0A1G2CDF1_9BACT|nr:MAG: hypothetical protein A2945_00975 [Candidatus Liptonbacteria bacterium RIFCSPLOWO2_01_FULL_52_25]